MARSHRRRACPAVPARHTNKPRGWWEGGTGGGRGGGNQHTRRRTSKASGPRFLAFAWETPVRHHCFRPLATASASRRGACAHTKVVASHKRRVTGTGGQPRRCACRRRRKFGPIVMGAAGALPCACGSRTQRRQHVFMIRAARAGSDAAVQSLPRSLQPAVFGGKSFYQPRFQTLTFSGARCPPVALSLSSACLLCSPLPTVVWGQEATALQAGAVPPPQRMSPAGIQPPTGDR